MYIKSVHIDGFKSYGKRVEVNGFDTKFNAITGLNGTGKSNILDSICFVLGITNLSHVRVNSLQELIFKNGQTGINSATVTLIFDNTDKDGAPPGYENFKDITITRQVIMGGKNKYWINGCIVPNKKVQDLFCSIQLNINNPHFLIMQGRVTKVLNMKAHEILAMLEEAAGTRMYEMKKITMVKTLEKKTAKMQELNNIINEEISPKLEKLKQERQSYRDYLSIERELTNMKNLYEAFLYYASQRFTEHSLKKLEASEADCQETHDAIKDNTTMIEKLTDQLKQLSEEANEASGGLLEELEQKVKEKDKSNAKTFVVIKSAKESITSEEQKMKQIEKHIIDDGALLQNKQGELSKVENLFENLKQNDENDRETFSLAQKKYEAICAGMEINESGQAQSLQEQLIATKEEASSRNTEIKAATNKLTHFEADLKKKHGMVKGSAGNDYNTAKANYEHIKKEVANLEIAASRLDYSEAVVTDLKQRHQHLCNDLRHHRDKVENFEARRPHTKFSYRDPTANFDRRQVQGIVCRLIKVKDPKYSAALEAAAGGKLYNIVCSNEQVSKQILQHGQLQQRCTFLPLNKIQGSRIPHGVVKMAQDLVGKDNVIPALSLIEYDAKIQRAMEFIFGSVFICTDLNVAKQITFHPDIKRRCVTLDGDVTDPSGTMSGGAVQKSAPVLMQIREILESEAQLKDGESDLQQLETEMKLKVQAQEEFQNLQQRLDLKRTELKSTETFLQGTSYHQMVQEVDDLKQSIEQLKEQIGESKKVEKECLAKIKEIETNLKDADGHRERTLKHAENEMKKAQKQADKSHKEWVQREAEYEALKFEIHELQQTLETSATQLKTCQSEIERLTAEHARLEDEFVEHKEELLQLQAEYKAEKTAINTKNKEINKKNDQKEKLAAQINEFQLEIQKQEHDIEKLRGEYNKAKSKETELVKRAEKIDRKILEDAAKMDDKSGNNLHVRITRAEETRTRLGRNINVNAQKMFEHEEKQHSMLIKRKKVIESDEKKLMQMIKDLDQKKKVALTLAYNQVKKDFGSIFSTLLPGANATLSPPPNKTILEGMEIKVSLGGIWKENLTELSGGQRSLAALSLILSMLLFKPAPLYILDEVDAALDLSHTQNIGTMLKNHFKQSQFIVVSLKDGMFSNANVLFRTKFIDGVSAVTRTVNKN